MWYEVLIGGLVGLATYMYLHYLAVSKTRQQLQRVGILKHKNSISLVLLPERLMFRALDVLEQELRTLSLS